MTAPHLHSPAPAAVTLDEARDWLGLTAAPDDRALGRLLVAATELVEGYLATTLIERAFTERLAPRTGWQRLARAPVVAITAAAADTDFGPRALSPIEWAADIAADATGLVRWAGEGAIDVTYRAGLALDAEGVPAAIRQGLLEMVRANHRARDAGTDAGAVMPMTALTLWRPFRRLGLGAPRSVAR